jgi:phage terminase large subunit-like protein
MRKAVSVGSETTGFRGNYVIIDDPLNAMDSYSAVKREKAVMWLDKAASTRLANPAEGAIVMIMQRLHHEDPSGHVLKQTQDRYEHVCLPTYFEPERAFQTKLISIPKYAKWGRDRRTQKDELLFPKFFTSKVVEGLEETLQPLAFAGQHQQRPTPAEGNLFRAEMLCNMENETPKFWPYPKEPVKEAYFSWDTAMKDKTHNDLTAGCLVMQSTDGFVYLIPVVLSRMEVPQLERTIALLWAQWKQKLGTSLINARIEEGAGTTLIQYLRQLMFTRRQQEQPPPSWSEGEWNQVRQAHPIQVVPFTSSKKKIERAHEILPYLNARNVRLVDTPLSRAWLDTLLGFPMAGHDDAVDATVAGVRIFAEICDKGVPAISAAKLRMATVFPDADPDDEKTGDF